MIDQRPGMEYLIGWEQEREIYFDYVLVDKYTRSLNVLRPHGSGGRIRIYRGYGDYWIAHNPQQQSQSYHDTRAQAAQAANEQT